MEITFSTGDAAFDQDDGRIEIARILQEIAAIVAETNERQGIVRDRNGNVIGQWDMDRVY